MKLRSRVDSSWKIPTAIYDGDDGSVVMIDNHSEIRILEGEKWRFITLHSAPEEFAAICNACPCSMEVGKGWCGKAYGHQGGHAPVKT